MTASPASQGVPDRDRLLAELARLGEYFALQPALPGSETHDLTDLFAEPALTDHIRRTRAAMAAAADCDPGRIPVRVAASSFQLGVAARLLSPVMGAALCFGAVPVLDQRALRWQPSPGHTPRIVVADPDWVAVPTEPAAARVIAASVLSALADLRTRLHALASLSPAITLGNLASAANGAVTVLALSRPELAPAGRSLVAALLDREPLAGTGRFLDGRFTRRSCCLYYQAPGGGLCGDCVLAVPDTSQHRPGR